MRLTPPGHNVSDLSIKLDPCLTFERRKGEEKRKGLINFGTDRGEREKG